MYFSTVVAFAALLFPVGAVPVSLNSLRSDRPISIPLTKRSNYLNDDGHVDHEKLQAGAYHSTARFHQALRAYESNTGERHPLALKRGHSNERRLDVAVPLTPNTNQFWTGDIAVGTPARSFSVAFDTQTSDMYLSGPSCPICNGQSHYDLSLSSTGKNLSSAFGFTVDGNFSLGIVSGYAVSDSVFVGGNEVDDMTILVATEVGPHFDFPGFPGDGILGMGFKETSALGTDSYFGKLVASGGPSNGEPVFGLVLRGSSPELIIGGRDSSKFSGNLTFIKVDTPGFWQIPVDAISINGNDVSLTNNDAIVDSGITFITADIDVIKNIYTNIPGAVQLSNTGQWSIPCDTNVIVAITIGGTEMLIPPSAYNIGVNSDNLCIGGFAFLNGQNGLMRIGTVFLQNVYAEFDQENLQVGFAPFAE